MMIILLLAGSLILIAAGQAQAMAYPVSIQNTAFNPKELTISAGDTVTWTNNDAMLHDVDLGALGKSPELHKGETYTKTFDRPGKYDYDCDIHPFMKGTVIVK
jgi:amicyanin